jgi:hypothetical protein
MWESSRREDEAIRKSRKVKRRQRVVDKSVLSTGEGTISIFKLRRQVLDGVAQCGNSPAWGGKAQTGSIFFLWRFIGLIVLRRKY